MTDEQIEVERALFIQWAELQGIDCTFWIPEVSELGFDNPRTSDYWVGWLASAQRWHACTE